jgi:hypothetical protein
MIYGDNKMNSNLEKEDRNKVGFYLVTNTVTDETYVGSGVLGECLTRHRVGYNTGHHANIKLLKAFKRARDNWEFIAIPIEEPGLTREENRLVALDIEQSIINDFYGKTQLFLNIASHVERPRLGLEHSTETKEKISSSHKAYWDGLSDEERYERTKNIGVSNKGNTYCIGRVLSDKTKDDISVSVKNYYDGLNNDEKSNWLEKIRSANCKSLIIDGVTYDSRTQAANVFGLTKEAIGYRVSSPNFPTWMNAI